MHFPFEPAIESFENPYDRRRDNKRYSSHHHRNAERSFNGRDYAVKR